MIKAKMPNEKRAKKLQKELERCVAIREQGFRKYVMMNSFWISVGLGAAIAILKPIEENPVAAFFRFAFTFLGILPICIFFHTLLWWATDRKLKRIRRKIG